MSTKEARERAERNYLGRLKSVCAEMPCDFKPANYHSYPACCRECYDRRRRERKARG